MLRELYLKLLTIPSKDIFYRYVLTKKKEKILHLVRKTIKYILIFDKREYGFMYCSRKKGFIFYIWGKKLDLSYLNIKTKLGFAYDWCVDELEADIWMTQIFRFIFLKNNSIIIFYYRLAIYVFELFYQKFLGYSSIFNFTYSKPVYINTIFFRIVAIYLKDMLGTVNDNIFVIYLKNLTKQTYYWNFQRVGTAEIIQYEDDIITEFREYIYEFKLVFRYFYSGDTDFFYNYIFLKLSNNLLDWDTLIFYKYDFIGNKQLVKVDIGQEDDDHDDCEIDEEDILFWF